MVPANTQWAQDGPSACKLCHPLATTSPSTYLRTACILRTTLSGLTCSTMMQLTANRHAELPSKAKFIGHADLSNCPTWDDLSSESRPSTWRVPEFLRRPRPQLESKAKVHSNSRPGCCGFCSTSMTQKAQEQVAHAAALIHKTSLWIRQNHMAVGLHLPSIQQTQATLLVQCNTT